MVKYLQSKNKEAEYGFFLDCCRSESRGGDQEKSVKKVSNFVRSDNQDYNLTEVRKILQQANIT